MEIKPELEQLLLHALMQEWRSIAWQYFHPYLKAPQLDLSDASSFLGRWEAKTRRITLARSLIYQQPWSVVREVLKHEIVHQYLEEILHIQESPHGPSFQRLCARIGADPNPTGIPKASQEENRILQRIHKLLALAGSPERHEAQAAAVAAQKLLLQYNLSLQNPSYSHRIVGPWRKRRDRWELVLAGILTGHFFVEAIWLSSYSIKESNWGSELELTGTHSNLEISAYVWDFLVHAAEAEWSRYRAARGIGNKDRRSFLTGVMHGFRTKLEEQGRKNQQEGLILAKDVGLLDWYHRRHPKIQTRTSSGFDPNAAYQQGVETGKNVVLNKGVSEATSNRGRLLG
jgi:hypothetical protein